MNNLIALIFCFLFLCAAFFSAAPGQTNLPQRNDYQKMAESAKWNWDAEQASVAFSAARSDGDYQIEIIRPPRAGFFEMKIRFIKNGKEIYAWTGHAFSVFAVENDVLYYADYSPIASGCTLVAFDLRSKKQLWRTTLKGLGSVAHSEYLNRVTLEIVNSEVVKVTGSETAGRYVEFIEMKTRRIVGHKIFAD